MLKKTVIIMIIIIFIKPKLVFAQTPVFNNYWPMQLGNYWNYEITEFDQAQFALWEQNFQGNASGVNNPSRICTDTSYRQNVLGSKVSMTVNPSMGYNRFNTSRYIQFYKEKGAAYHGPKYCNLLPEAPNSWDLQWYMHNPVFKNNTYWLGSEGGVRFSRTVLNGDVNISSADRENLTENAGYGYFPQNSIFNSGAGRYPADDTVWNNLPGYTYLPLTTVPENVNNVNRVVPDLVYKFGMGRIIDKDSFNNGISTYFNDFKRGRLDWELEYVPLKAGSVLTKGLLPATTDILSIIFFEPYFGGKAVLSQNDEIACENWYFAKNIGLVKLTHSIVSVLPNDSDLTKTRALCFYLFKNDFLNSTDAAKRLTGFTDLIGYENDIALFKYNTPKNSFEITSYKIYQNSAQDNLGFHSPSAASIVSVPEANSIEYYANGRYWLYDSKGNIYIQGNLYEAWKNKNIPGVVIGGITVYPWTDNGPDALENGNDVINLFGVKGLVINNGAYWFRNAGDAVPFPGGSGKVADLLPEYANYFGDNTDNLGLSGTGANEIFLQKDGKYLYFGKDADGKISLLRSGNNADLSSWANASKIGGLAPLAPDTLMYGSVFKQSNNYDIEGHGDLLPLPAENQLIIFQKGAVWVKYGFEGGFENWKDQLKSGFTEIIPSPTPFFACSTCLSGLAKSLGNANCDGKINAIDFALWKKVYLNPLAAEAEKAEVDFNCQSNDLIHKINLVDFKIWAGNYR